MAPSSDAPDGRPRRRPRLAPQDRWPVLVLVLVPVLVFVVPAIAGHPAIAGDNLIQNFPLRALSGELIAHGHLPLWNPYIWSGNPLLGGLNAGSLYPFTLLFVVLPPVAAWVGNLLVVYWAAGLGFYALGRQLGLGARAALLAAATYAFAGTMAGQLVHIGVVQGYAWLPLLVLALLRLSWTLFGVGPVPGPDDRPVDGAAPPVRASRSAWPWLVLLAVTLGLCLLTGEPRAMGEAEVVAAVVTLWLTLRRYPVAVGVRRRLTYLGCSIFAGLWGVGLAAVQLLPGWRFISGSQRSNEPFAFFVSGSLHPQWSVLLLVPDLFGGAGILHQPTYFNSYNLPEVTGYVGLLPLVAALALLTRSVGRGRDPRAADWAMWLFLTGLGLLMAFGGYTWFGGLFGFIPFFNKLRLQSRNLGIVDLGLAALLGYWVEQLLSSCWREAGMAGWRRVVAAAPLAATIALCVVALSIPFEVEVAFGSSPSAATLGAYLRPWVLAELVVALGALALLLVWGRLGAGGRGRLVSAVVVADLLLFAAATSTGLSNGNATIEPSTAAATAVLGSQGRFAIYDTTNLNVDDLSSVGQPDLNAFTKLGSVEGYGSLIAGAYGTVTGTHDLDTLDPCALARGVFVPLRLHTLLALPSALAPELGANGQPTSMGGAAPMPLGTSCPGAPAPGRPGRRALYFGQVLPVASATLAAGAGRAAPTVAVLRATGATSVPAQTVRAVPGGWAVRFASTQPAAGLVVSGGGTVDASGSLVVTPGGTRYSLDGQLQDALGQSGWRFTGLWHEYGRFSTRSLRPPVWLVGASPGSEARQVSTSAWGTEVDTVRATGPVTLVRSEAYQPGWRVVAVSSRGRMRHLGVKRAGLIQSVRLPGGDWTVTFLYRATGLNLGLAGSSVAAGAMVAVAVGVLWRRHRRRRAEWAGGR